MTAGPSTRELLANRNVVVLLGAELLVSGATTALTTTLGWQGYQRTHSPLTLGLIGLAEFVPALLFAIPAGQIADRIDRRLVVAAGVAATALTSFALALDAASGDRQAWPLYVLALLLGCSQSFAQPSFNPLLAASVEPISLPRVIAMSAVTWQTAGVLGPAIGGLAQRYSNPGPYIGCGVATLVAAGLVLLYPRALGRAHVGPNREPATLREAFGGVRMIMAAPALLGAISLDLMAVLFGGATALLPVFSSDVLHVGALGNGILRSAPGVGAVIVGLWLSVHPIRRRIGPTLFIVVALYGAFTILFGASRSFVLSLVALAALAGADMFSVLIRASLQPLLTPPPMRGRVSAVERVFIGGSNELGAFESGTVAAAIGAVPAVIIGGALSIAVAIVWAWRFPSLRTMDRFEDVRFVELPDRDDSLSR
ncbi:MAG TPA: MFS transporter [Gaiellales bacterium]